MYQMIEQELSRQTELEERRSGTQGRRLRDLAAFGGAKAVPDVAVAIREAQSADVPELKRLAQLDSRPLPDGSLLVAEAGGRIRAAIAIDSDALVADPFVPTAELGSLLALRAQQVRRERRGGRRGLGGALHVRARRPA